MKPAYNSNATHNDSHNYSKGIYHYIINFLTWVLLYYVNAYVLIPRFINLKKYRSYFVYLLIIIFVLIIINYVSFTIFIPEIKYQFNPFVIFYLLACLFMIALGTAIRLLQYREIEQKRSKEQITENLKTELSFLRSQVSPHFMFNVLNNMVALARKKSDLLEPSLIKLSSLLRYMLYETDEKDVNLEKEIDYLQSYVDLQKQRFGKNVDIKINSKTDQNYLIEPMLLIPFVENAFKHGTGFINDAFIHIDLQAVNGKLDFKVANKFNSQLEEVKDKTSGIGLTNVKRRLNLLYGNNHKLEVVRQNGEFVASLHLNLH